MVNRGLLSAEMCFDMHAIKSCIYNINVINAFIIYIELIIIHSLRTLLGIPLTFHREQSLFLLDKPK
jgi:hypothetical protein